MTVKKKKGATTVDFDPPIYKRQEVVYSVIKFFVGRKMMVAVMLGCDDEGVWVVRSEKMITCLIPLPSSDLQVMS
ncbi:unnamed protein product [Lactuca virosa]|uniref:Uncharacterized protein n=1 Tax=Lactuca virosa TaxID=75947 RepID=A0AAU9P3M1_9ASTR|nr:unnamed protein product [Lactuca virosa]